MDRIGETKVQGHRERSKERVTPDKRLALSSSMFTYALL